MTARKTGPRDN
ncbi:hypothetical protein VTL71DRAFT_14051 [Oculimacula yallundae]|uniref:Uncharacterized protein n=1 Tax=Oculimacula yallundae TaxID=86028 RepID=A0ABR4CM45_9HELO